MNIMSKSDHNHLSGLGISMDKLEKEMNEAISNDSLYWMKNDAKLRAVQQGVPTYEDFRQLVSGCHLKPMDKSEIMKFNIKSNSKWNSWTNCYLSNSHSWGMNTEFLKTPYLVNSPQEFYTKWQFLTNKLLSGELTVGDVQSKLITLLFNQSNELFEKLFNTGLGVSLLSNLIEVLYRQTQGITNQTTSDQIKEFVTKFFNVWFNCAKSKQFTIAMDCLIDSEKHMARDLLLKLGELLSALEGMNEQKMKLEEFYKCYFNL